MAPRRAIVIGVLTAVMIACAGQARADPTVIGLAIATTAPSQGAGGYITGWGSDASLLGVQGFSRPGPVPGPGRAASIAGGHRTTVVVRPDGTVWEWGISAGPSPVRELTNAVSVAVGATPGDNWDDSWALKVDGSVWTWGYIYADGRDLTRVAGLTGVIQIAASHPRLLALEEDGTVWQVNDTVPRSLGEKPTALPHQIASLSHIRSVSAGSDHSLALSTDGRVWTWLTAPGSQPTLVPGPSGVGYLKNISAIAAGDRFSLAVDSGGGVWAWGTNREGQLGTGTQGRAAVKAAGYPLRVPGLSRVVTVAAGLHHSLALDSLGTVWAWGGNSHGEVGNTFATMSRARACNCTDTPVRIPTIHDAVTIAAGPVTSFALTRSPVPLARLPSLSPCMRIAAKPVARATPRWTVPLDALPEALDVGESTDRVFLLTPGHYDAAVGDYTCTGSVTTVDLVTGSVLRTVPVGVWPGSMTVVQRLNRVVVFNHFDRDRNGSVSILDAANGRLIKTTRFDDPGRFFAISKASGRIFVQGWTADVAPIQILDAASGARLGEFPVPASYHLGVVDETLNRVFVTATGRVEYLNDIIALDASTGALLGRSSVTDSVAMRNACGYEAHLLVSQRPDRLYVVSDLGTCIVDAKTLKLFSVISGYWLEAVDERAHILVGTTGGGSKFSPCHLELVDARDSTIVRSHWVFCNYVIGQHVTTAVAVDEKAGSIYFYGPGKRYKDGRETGSNSINVLDPVDWQIVRRVPVPAGIDGGIGHEGLLIVAQNPRRLLAVTRAGLRVWCIDKICR